MFSIAKVGSSGAATHYYEKDDYYTKDDSEHKSHSEWYGKGASKLNLTSKVEKEDFKNILDGKLPNGQILGRVEDGKIVHAPGTDLTFSAPKSVSIAAEVLGDLRIYEAHRKAVLKTLGYIENNLVGTRKKSNGEMINEKVTNAIFALFQHSTSRNLDPQLHTHCIMANAAERDDGQWRSVLVKKIYESKLFIGQMYRADLAYELKQLGYDIRITPHNSGFELKEISDGLIDAFSGRAKEIAKAAGGYEKVDAKLKAKLALETRKPKEEVSKEQLVERWQKIMNEQIAKDREVGDGNFWDKKNPWNILGNKFELGIFKEFKYFCESIKDGIFKNVEKAAINYAIEHLSERQSVWKTEEMLDVALKHAIGYSTIDKIIKRLNLEVKRGNILESSDGTCTTKAMVKKEMETVDLMRSGIGETKAVYSRNKIKKCLENSTLNEGQRGAIELMLSSKDRVVGVQGYAGVGKTYMLKSARELAEGNGYRMIGLAPTRSAASTLAKDTGIESLTLDKFLVNYKRLIDSQKTEEDKANLKDMMKKMIVVLDEASLASTEKYYDLLKIAKELDLKVVALGDVRQLNGVGAGKPFAQAQDNGMKTAHVKEIVRQKNPKLKEAVYHSIEGNIEAAFEKLKGNIIELYKDREPRDDERDGLDIVAAKQWLSLSREDRENTLIISPSHSLRRSINHQIREQLKLEGELKGEGVKLVILNSKNFTQAQMSNPQSYGVGDIVLFNRSYASLGIKKGDYLEVKGVRKNVVVLVNQEGQTVGWKPDEIGGKRKGATEVYKKDFLEIKVGDRLRWTRNGDNPEVVNTKKATVVGINDKHIILKSEANQIYSIARSDNSLKHLDYTYAVTAHSAQGLTINNVIGVIKAAHKHLTNQPLFYVTMSRAIYNVIIFTENINELASSLTFKDGKFLSAQEHQGIENIKDETAVVVSNNSSKSSNAAAKPEKIAEKQPLVQKLEEVKPPNNKNEVKPLQPPSDRNNFKSLPSQKEYRSESRFKYNNLPGYDEIYRAIYHKLPTLLSEFGFRREGRGYISTTTHKTDGTSGKKGKVYVYENNPGMLIDYAGNNISLWDYLRDTRFSGASNKEMMKNLRSLAGLSNDSDYVVKKSIVRMLSAPDAKLPEVKPAIDRKILEAIDAYARKEILKDGNIILKYLQDKRGYGSQAIQDMGLGAILSKRNLGYYLRSVGFTREQVKEGYKALHYIGDTHNLIMPFKDDKGELMGFAGRNIDYKDTDERGKYLYTKGLSRSNTLLNVHNLNGAKEAILVEGMLDSFHAQAKGLNNVLALGGTGFNNRQLHMLNELGVKTIILCLDNDKAGDEAAKKIKLTVQEAKLSIAIKTAKLPQDIKDPDQMIKEKGVEAFKECISKAALVKPIQSIGNDHKTIFYSSNLRQESGMLNNNKDIEIEK